MSEIAGEMTDFSKIPEACLSHVLSFTSPRDSCVSSTVSTIFKSAVDSDIVWEKFLPSDYQEILNRTVDDIKFLSKQDLYFKLCSPVLIDGGKLSFQLEKSSGAKCFMISAKALSIAWGDTPKYWEWITVSDLRFQEVAYLKGVWWLEFWGKIESEMLTKNTRYAAYLVYKLDKEIKGLGFPGQKTTIKVGVNESKSYVRLNSDDVIFENDEFDDDEFDNDVIGGFERIELDIVALNEIKVYSTRIDGWLEIEMGEFYNDNGDDGEIEVRLLSTEDWNSGLTIYGIEVRPKK